jgi:hypothetical protein
MVHDPEKNISKPYMFDTKKLPIKRKGVFSMNSAPHAGITENMPYDSSYVQTLSGTEAQKEGSLLFTTKSPSLSL